MIDTIDSLNIKKFLQSGPKAGLSEQPLFRLVWSDDEYELRKGTFGRFYGGEKISEYEAVEYRPKYSWLKERWVLEQWFGPQVTYMKELPESKSGSYEPIYVFESHAGSPLPLNLEVVAFIVKNALKPKTSEQLKKSIAKEQAEAKTKQAEQADWDMLNDEGPLVSQFHDGSAVLNIFDSNPDKENK